MNLDDAIGIVANLRLAVHRMGRRADEAGANSEARDQRRYARALSLVMWAAKDVADLRRELAPKPSILKEPYAPKPKQVAPFMFECPGCLQHFGRGKGPYGLARHGCHESHPRLRRAR